MTPAVLTALVQPYIVTLHADDLLCVALRYHPSVTEFETLLNALAQTQLPDKHVLLLSPGITATMMRECLGAHFDAFCGVLGVTAPPEQVLAALHAMFRLAARDLREAHNE